MVKVFLVDDEIVIREGIRTSFPWEKTEYMRHLEGMDGLYLPGEFDDDEEEKTVAEEILPEDTEE